VGLERWYWIAGIVVAVCALVGLALRLAGCRKKLHQKQSQQISNGSGTQSQEQKIR